MKKRFLSLCLAFVICLGLTVPAYAAAVQATAGANLTKTEQKIYTALADAVTKVAMGQQPNTKVTIEFEPGELSWTARELGLSSIDDNNVFWPVDERVYDVVQKIWDCLRMDFPFEMFWVNNSFRTMAWEEHTGSSAWLTSLDCWLEAIPAYRDGKAADNDTVDPDKIAQGRAAAGNAKAIVLANAGKSDYEKLTAYRDAVCSLTSYNFDAADENEKSGYLSYGDPWQLVYVFDGDPGTNVLCEGYAKAFKYLCDLSEFNGDVACYITNGDMDGVAHMWNVVRMGDGNLYLVDVTNSDTDMIGERGGLFLTGASGSGQKYVVSHDGWRCTYTYDEGQKGLLTDGYLSLSSKDYSPADDVAPVVKPAPAPSFTDVPDWCAKAVNWAVDKGVTKGVGGNKFDPGTDCTHAQILTMLWRAAGEVEIDRELSIQVAEPYRKAILWADDMGMIDLPTLDPNASCSRGDAMRYISQALLVSELDGANGFTDVPADAPYAYAVAWAVKNGVTNGYPNEDGTASFLPGKVCSRGEIVTFLHRAYVPSARLK